MVPLIKVTGRTIFNMEKESSFGTTIQNMMVNIQKVKNTDMEATHGKTALVIPELGRIIEFMDEEHTYGMMEESMRAIGLTIIWMAMDNTTGKMVVNTSDNILKIRNTVKECTLGLMEDNMMENGLMEDNME
jgi:hypothetical protein